MIGADGKVRIAELRSISKKGKVTKITRPLQKIIPLEVRNDVSQICDVDVPQVVTVVLIILTMKQHDVNQSVQLRGLGS